MHNTPEEREGSQDTLKRARRERELPGDLWLKAEAVGLGWPDAWGTFLPQQKASCVVSVLRIMVLEVSTTQMPTLRLLHLCPIPMQTVTNTYRVSSFSLLSGKTWLSSFPLEGRGDRLRAGQVRSLSHLL